MINVEIKEMKQILDDKLKGIITTALQDNDHPLNELLPKTRSEERTRKMCGTLKEKLCYSRINAL